MNENMIYSACDNLGQLKDLLTHLRPEDYQSAPDVLSGATIGQHLRHILEFYQLLISDFCEGEISYDKRSRDPRIEIDKEYALKIIDILANKLDLLKDDLKLNLRADYSVNGDSINIIGSSLGRELAYCIEHSIHHQALIRAGLISLGLEKLVNDDFGVAYSTIRFRNTNL